MAIGEVTNRFGFQLGARRWVNYRVSPTRCRVGGTQSEPVPRSSRVGGVSSSGNVALVRFAEPRPLAGRHRACYIVLYGDTST